MARVHFNAHLIADLRRRVIEHNQGVGDDGRATKLEELKKLYRRAYQKAKGPNPGAKAMAKVDAFLSDLTKAEQPFDESKVRRDSDGKFADKPDAPRAASRADHQRRQKEDPEYRATTTSVIPETRYGASGAFVRDAGSLAAGAGVTLALLRGTPGVLSRAGAGVVGRVGSVALKVPTYAVARGAVAAANLGARGANAAINATERGARDSLGLPPSKRAGNVVPSVDPDVARRAGAFMGRYGEKGALLVAGLTAKGLGAVGRAAVDGVSIPNPTGMKQKVSNKVRRGIMIGAMSLPVGLTIRSTIKDGMLDPEVIGRGFDAFSSREVQKLDAARDEIMAKLDGLTVNDVLTKAAPRPWSRVASMVFPAAAAAVGGAVGGGATYAATSSKKRGNPYRDEDGKFTSKDRAAMTVGGALLGGAAAGLATYAAMRRGNAKAFGARVRNMIAGREERVKRILEPNGAPGSRVSRLMAGKAQRIQEIQAANPALKARLDEMRRFGQSDAFHFIERARDEVTGRMAETMATITAIRMPKGSSAETVGGVINKFGIAGARRQLASALDGLDDAGLERMLNVRGVSDAQKEALRSLHRMREGVPDQIRNQLAAHAQKINDQMGAVELAGSRARTAKLKLEDAGAKYAAAPEGAPDKQTLKEAFDKATDAFDKAAGRETKARTALQDLKANPAGAVFPLSNQPIPAPSAAVLDQARQKVEREAADAAERVFEKEVAKAREADTLDVTKWSNRLLAAQQMIGLKQGYVPKNQRYAAQRFAASGRRVRGLEASVRRAEMDVSMARGAVKADPKSPVAAGNLADAQKRLAEAKTALNAAEMTLNRAGAAFEQSLADAARAAGRPSIAKRIMQNGTMRALARDVARVQRAAKTPADKFLATKTAERLREFAANAKKSAVGAAAKSNKIFAAAFRQAFKKPDGTWSVPKLMRFGTKGLFGTGALGGLYLGGREAGSAAYDLAFGDEKTRAAVVNPIGKGRAFQVDDEIDPITGEGYVVITVRDPENKNERLVLWGERERGEKNEDGSLVVGARLSDVKRRVQEEKQKRQQQGGGGGGNLKGAQNFSGQERGAVDQALSKLRDRLQRVDAVDGSEGSFSWRPDSDGDHREAASGFVRWLSGSGNMADNGLSGSKMLSALENGLFTIHGQVLKPRDAYGLLTGYAPDGARRNKAIFPRNEAFGPGGDAFEGMVDVVNKAMADLPNMTNDQRTQLHRAVTLVGKVKNLSTDQQKTLHQKIREGRGDAEAAKVSGGARQEAPPRIKVSDTDFTPNFPDGWDEDLLHGGAEIQTARIGKLGRVFADQQMRFPTYRTIRALAIEAKNRMPSLKEDDAVRLAGDAIEALATRPGKDKDGVNGKMEASGSILVEAPEAFWAELDRQLVLYQKGVKKADLLDDFDALMKVAFRQWDESKHKRDDEGEFANKDGSEGRETERDGSGAQQRQPKPRRERAQAQPQPPAERDFTEPVRLGTEVGTQAASQLAWSAAERFLPATARMSAQALRFGGMTAASMAAGSAGGMAGGEAGKEVYRLQGKKDPGDWDGPQYSGVGEMVSEFAANTAGWIGGAKAGAVAGTAVGGPIGTAVGGFVGGVVGGVAGSELGRQVYRRYLSRYGDEATSAISRYFDDAPSSGMRKRAPVPLDTRLSPCGAAQINQWFAGYGPLAKRASRHFQPGGRA